LIKSSPGCLVRVGTCTHVVRTYNNGLVSQMA
jgi:hypothetical protein